MSNHVQIQTLSVPIAFVAFLILSIILFIKRNKIIAKYDVGYISSFLFSSYMLTPVFAMFFTLVSPSKAENLEFPVSVLIYPIIGLSIFLFVYRGNPFSYKLGKFFAMIGLGICSGYVLVFKLLGIIHLFESSSGNSKSVEQFTEPIPNTKTTGDIFRGRVNACGEIYDYGGKLLARINDNGDIFYPNGSYYAHRDYSGDVYDASGKYLGRIKENGEIQNADWTYTGKLNND